MFEEEPIPINKIVTLYDNYFEVGQVQKAPRRKIMISMLSTRGVKSLRLHTYVYISKYKKWIPTTETMIIPFEILMKSNNELNLYKPLEEVLAYVDAAMESFPGFALYDENNVVKVPKASLRRGRQKVGRFIVRKRKDGLLNEPNTESNTTEVREEIIGNETE